MNHNESPLKFNYCHYIQSKQSICRMILYFTILNYHCFWKILPIASSFRKNFFLPKTEALHINIFIKSPNSPPPTAKSQYRCWCWCGSPRNRKTDAAGFFGDEHIEYRPSWSISNSWYLNDDWLKCSDDDLVFDEYQFIRQKEDWTILEIDHCSLFEICSFVIWNFKSLSVSAPQRFENNSG